MDKETIIKEYNSKLNTIDILNYIKLNYLIFSLCNAIFNVRFNQFIRPAYRVFWRKSKIYTIERILFETFEIIYIFYSFYTIHNIYKQKIANRNDYSDEIVNRFYQFNQRNKVSLTINLIFYGYLAYFVSILYTNVNNLKNYRKYTLITYFKRELETIDLTTECEERFDSLKNLFDKFQLEKTILTFDFAKKLALKDIHDSLSRGKKKQQGKKQQQEKFPMVPTGPILPVAPIFTQKQKQQLQRDASMVGMSVDQYKKFLGMTDRQIKDIISQKQQLSQLKKRLQNLK